MASLFALDACGDLLAEPVPGVVQLLRAVGEREPCGVCDFLCGENQLAPAFLRNLYDALGAVRRRDAVDSATSSSRLRSISCPMPVNTGMG